jgi:large conductance mechanosensitive channel
VEAFETDGEVVPMWKDFKAFITKGNLVDIAVAFVMGVAFGALVKSFLDDLVMPLIGKLVGNVDFANLYVNLSGQTYPSAQAARAAGAAAIYYGAFVNVFINFLVIGFVVFLLVRAAMKAKKKAEVAAPSTGPCPFCKTAVPIGASRCPHCTSQLATR